MMMIASVNNRSFDFTNFRRFAMTFYDVVAEKNDSQFPFDIFYHKNFQTFFVIVSKREREIIAAENDY